MITRTVIAKSFTRIHNPGRAVVAPVGLLALAVVVGCGPSCDDCEDMASAIEAEANKRNDGGSCGPFGQPSADSSHYYKACDELRECIGDDEYACAQSRRVFGGY